MTLKNDFQKMGGEVFSMDEARQKIAEAAATTGQQADDWRTTFQLPEQDPADGTHLIDVSLSDHDATQKAWKAIRHHNAPPRLFLHGLDVVTLQTVEGRPVIVPVCADTLRAILGDWIKWNRRELDARAGWRWKAKNCRLDVVKSLLHSPDKPLPVLKAVVNVPVFSPDGHLNTEPGYSPQTGLFYAPPSGFVMRPLPERVTDRDVREAKAWLDDILHDFPFVTDNKDGEDQNTNDGPDKQNAIALFLLSFVREMISGPTPCHLITATTPGSGKGLLAHVMLSAAISSQYGVLTAPKNDDDWRKQLTSALLSGRPVIHIDNLTGPLDSGVLAAALTCDVWDDRILGSSKLAFVPVRSAFVCTANNPDLSNEIGRRCVEIRLTPKTAEPEERTDFRHPDLKTYVEENRAHLVWSAHVLILNWLQAGRPGFSIRRGPGSYENWTKVIGGILETAGYTKFLANFSESKDRMDYEREARAAFCHYWWTHHYNAKADTGAAMTAKKLFETIVPHVIGIPISGTTLRGEVKSFGKWLNGSIDMLIRNVEDDDYGKPIKQQIYSISRGKKQHGLQYYVLKMVEETIL